MKGDLEAALAGGEHALVGMAMATHAGMTSEEFDAIVTDWITTAKHPKTGRPYTEMVYQPMLELLDNCARTASGPSSSAKGRTVVDMKTDWKRVYPFNP